MRSFITTKYLWPRRAGHQEFVYKDSGGRRPTKPEIHKRVDGNSQMGG